VKESAMSSDSMEVLDYAAELRSGPGFAWNMSCCNMFCWNTYDGVIWL